MTVKTALFRGALVFVTSVLLLVTLSSCDVLGILMDRINPDAAAVEADASALSIEYAQGDNAASVRDDLGLSVQGGGGSIISWTSSAPSVIAILGNTGEVTRPGVGESSATVKLTAKVELGDERRTVDFALVVVPWTQEELDQVNAQNDSESPTPGTGISFGTVTSSSVLVSWGEANDNQTPAGDLSYRIVVSTNADAIDTKPEISAVSGSGVVLEWTTGTVSVTASGLSGGTTYFFSGLVKDEAGNLALMVPAQVTTLDDVPPVVGTSVTFSQVGETSLTVEWGAATDAITSAADLEYKVGRAASAAEIDTIAEVDALSGDSLVMDWSANTYSVAETGLSSQTTYYFAVLVRDAAGNVALYSPQSVTTLGSATAGATWSGYQSSSVSLPRAASSVAGPISAASHNVVGLTGNGDSRTNWAFNNSASSVDPDTAPYLSFVATVPGGSATFDRFVLGSYFMYGSGKVQLRWSVDGFANSLGEFSAGSNWTLTSVDLLGHGTVSATSVEFRLYCYNGSATAAFGSAWSSPYSTVDGTPSSYNTGSRPFAIWYR